MERSGMGGRDGERDEKRSSHWEAKIQDLGEISNRDVSGWNETYWVCNITSNPTPSSRMKSLIKSVCIPWRECKEVLSLASRVAWGRTGPAQDSSSLGCPWLNDARGHPIESGRPACSALLSADLLVRRARSPAFLPPCRGGRASPQHCLRLHTHSAAPLGLLKARLKSGASDVRLSGCANVDFFENCFFICLAPVSLS